jgi:hypothetical protein
MVSFVIEVLMKIIANSPPAILIVLSFLLLFFGYTANIGDMINAGWVFFGFGVFLQGLWLYATNR